MSILTYPLGFIGGGKEFYNGVMENSLRFNDDDSAYLSRTPSAASNGQTFTISLWFKRGNLGISGEGDSYHRIFSGTDGTSGNLTEITLNADSGDVDTLIIQNSKSGANVRMETAGHWRDPSAWYHLVVTFDTTLATTADRIKTWINGKNQSLSIESGTAIGQNDVTNVNQANIHYFGRGGHYNVEYDGYLTDIYLIDGYALGPENFGEYKEGVWIPKAYAGPPPLLTDSSGKNNELSVGTANTHLLNTSKAYIGDTSINVIDQTAKQLRFGPSSDFAFGTGEFTMEFWGYALSTPGADTDLGFDNWQKWGGGSQVGTVDATHQMSQWWGTGTTYAWSTSPGSQNWTGNLTIPFVNKWAHVSVVRDSKALNFYVNGIRLVANTSGSTANTGFGLGHADHQWVFATQEGSAYSWDGYVDELRIAKEALPPRFYFGTNYGDQSGGVMPHRATSAHRFTDDERTVLLVSGQSANGHARAVSLVDESGFHADNVHLSNSSISVYPTQDGIGKQFTISGPQQTTKESFIGNTSSIVMDGIDDALQIAHSADLQTGTGDFQIDFWINQNDVVSPPSDVYIFVKGGFGSSDTDGYVFRFSSTTEQTIQFYYRVSSTNYLAFTAPFSGIQNNTWAHMAMVRKSGTNYCYVDGKMLASATTGGTLDAGSTYVSRIGSPYDGAVNKFVNGYMD